MKPRRISRPCIFVISTLVLLLQVAFPVVAQAQFSYTGSEDVGCLEGCDGHGQSPRGRGCERRFAAEAVLPGGRAMMD